MLGYADAIDHAEWYSDEEHNQLCKTCMEQCHYWTRQYWPCDNHVHAENIRRLVKNHACACHKNDSQDAPEDNVTNQNDDRVSSYVNDISTSYGRTQQRNN